MAISALSVTVTVSAAHDGIDTTEYRLIVDGAPAATKPVTELKDGRIAFDVSSDPGAHTYAIEAFREPERSETKTVTVG